MRVIAGRFRSRPLLAPDGLATRPTTDRLRETLFNVLCHGAVDRVSGGAFLDLYAGSGAVGIEALSRGAERVTFVEQAAPALAVLKGNLESLGVRAGISVERRSAEAFLRLAVKKPDDARYSVIFLDPPWDEVDAYAQVLGLLGGECASLLAEGGVVVAEHRRKRGPELRYGQLERTRLLEQGDAGLSFYAAPDDAEVWQAAAEEKARGSEFGADRSRSGCCDPQ